MKYQLSMVIFLASSLLGFSGASRAMNEADITMELQEVASFARAQRSRKGPEQDIGQGRRMQQQQGREQRQNPGALRRGNQEGQRRQGQMGAPGEQGRHDGPATGGQWRRGQGDNAGPGRGTRDGNAGARWRNQGGNREGHEGGRWRNQEDRYQEGQRRHEGGRHAEHRERNVDTTINRTVNRNFGGAQVSGYRYHGFGNNWWRTPEVFPYYYYKNYNYAIYYPDAGSVDDFTPSS